MWMPSTASWVLKSNSPQICTPHALMPNFITTQASRSQSLQSTTEHLPICSIWKKGKSSHSWRPSHRTCSAKLRSPQLQSGWTWELVRWKSNTRRSHSSNRRINSRESQKQVLKSVNHSWCQNVKARKVKSPRIYNIWNQLQKNMKTKTPSRRLTIIAPPSLNSRVTEAPNITVLSKEKKS